MKKLINSSRQCLQCKSYYVEKLNTTHLRFYCSAMCETRANLNATNIVINTPVTARIKVSRRKDTTVKHRRNRIKKGKDRDFYDSRPWLELRYSVLRKYGRECMACGTTKGSMHVDHIKPRSKHPELSLKFSNLQVLCKECNLGKSNKDETDFRKLPTIEVCPYIPSCAEPKMSVILPPDTFAYLTNRLG